MIPYANFLYFGVLLYVVIPTLALGIVGHTSRRWVLLATVAMLAVQYGGDLQIGSQTEIRELWIVAGYALFEWGVALGFLRLHKRVASRWPFWVALFLALLPLVVARSVPLLAPNFQLGFLGISYVTFRNLDVIICVQDRLISSLPPRQLLAYLFFFGTISSGPIDRYRRFETDWNHRRTRAEFLRDLDGAVHRTFTGFFYKFILAALVKQHWLDPVAAQTGILSTLSYMYAYSFYLFFDFAGYSAFAIAVSYLFGIHTPENFNRPFLARNIRDFWNRWHITLSWWLRDHVYMRFVMAAMKGRWFKNKYVASSLGLLLAFGLMGLWHGPAPHYLIYGLYHGILLASYEAFARWNARRKLWGDGPLWQLAGIVGTFQCVCFGFLLFSGHLSIGASSQPTAGAAGHAYEGRHEKAGCDEVAGWAWDAHNPQSPVNVEIHVDNSLRATVRADLLRADLVAAGKGNGAHGFIYILPSAWKDGHPHSVSVRIAGDGTNLGGSARSIVCEMSVQSMDGYEGILETADCGSIGGWARDATRPDESISVDVYADGTLLQSVTANQVPNLASSSGRDDDSHRFVVRTPEALKDGRAHTISVRLSGSNVTLRNSPKIVTCSAAGGIDAGSTPAETEPRPADSPTPATESKRDVQASFVDNGDGTITDIGRGLMWEKKIKMDGKVDDANLNDADNCYPWGGTCATSNVDCRVDADCGTNGPCLAGDCQHEAPNGMTIFKWAERLNATRFAGYDDWRIPSSAEIYSIVNPLEEGDPAADAAFKGTACGAACSDLGDPACACAQPGLYWAAPVAAPKPDESWMMYFYCTDNLFLDLKANRFFVRAVRTASVAR